MSLINDALRRAKQAQQKNPPAAAVGPPLRPVEAARRPGAATGWLLPMSVVAVLVAAGVLLRGWLKTSKPITAQKALASAATTVAPAPPVAGTQSIPNIHPVQTPPRPEIATPVIPPKNGEANAAATAAPPPPAVKTEPPPQLAPEAGEANAVATAAPPPPAVKAEPPPQPVAAVKAPIVTTEPPAPKPAPLKLQGILYRPADPTAIINGKTVRIGDRIGEALIVGINQDGVAVAAAGQTNVLRMPR